MRRVLLTLALSVVLVTSVTGAGEIKPLKIGVLASLTGVYAGGGWLGIEGVKLALEGVNFEIAGRPVQLFIEDSSANPTMVVQKARRLAEREKVQLILGPLSGGEGMALKDYADRIPNVTIIVSAAASEDITMRGIKDNVFRTAMSGSQVMFPFGKYAYEKLGIKRIATLGDDYAFPYSQVGGFLSTYLLAGGECVARIWSPLGTTDFSSFIAQIPTDIDALLVTLGGSAGINFIKQLKEYGLKDKVKILGESILVDPVVLSQTGEDLVGVLAASHYAQDLPYKEFKDFDAEFVERNGLPSSLWAADYYISARVAIAALQEINGNIEDQAAFRAALRKVKMDTPRGPFAFDDNRQSILTTYITQVKEIDGQYRNVPLESFPNQDQFGPFDPDWYQAQPPFGRDTPTLDLLKSAKYR